MPGERYREFDLLVFTSIPHSAIGVKNSYALVDYVEAGGGVVFTGGEYAFGKGGYIHTVLERELLPVKMTAMTDTVYPETPEAIEPGPDFGELGVDADFTAEPVYWVRNEVVLKPGAKVFLKSGDRPILVGWQRGKGRVVCLLVDHRGKSEGGVTAFFDWADWPELMAAVIKWAAPNAKRTDPPPAPTPKADEADDLAGDMDDLLDVSDTDADMGLPSVDAPKTEAQLRAERRDAEMAIIDHEGPGRVDEGIRKVNAWNAEEAKVRAAFAEKVAPDLAMLETSPCLNADATLARLGWLAYLARHKPETYAQPFLRQGLMADQYRDYYGRTAAAEISQNKLEGRHADAVRKRWNELARRFQALQTQTRPDAQALLKSHPTEAGSTIGTVRFTTERQAALNLLGALKPDDSTRLLETVAQGTDADLVAFARQRLTRPGN